MLGNFAAFGALGIGVGPFAAGQIGALIVRNTHRVRFCLSSAHPYRNLFLLVAARLKPG